MRDNISIQVTGLVIAVAIVAGAGIIVSSNDASARLEPSPRELMEKGEVWFDPMREVFYARRGGRMYLCETERIINREGGRPDTRKIGPCEEFQYVDE